MKTMTKRIASVALAAIMALTVLVSALPAKAFAAAPTGTLTITSSNKEFKDKTVTAWQMFSATATADGKGATYTLNDEWVPFFKTVIGGNMATLDSEKLSDAAAAYVGALCGGVDDHDDVIAFAKKASDWAKAQKPALSAKHETTAKAGVDAFVAEFTDLAYGYYVVSPVGGSTDVNNKRGTDAILANVVKGTQDVLLKSEYPTVEKTLEDGQNRADAQIGDSLNFVLKSKVPDMAEYKNGYTFNFIDTLSKGLTLDSESIKVFIGVVELTKGEDYSVATEPVDTNKTKLTISMLDFSNRHQADAGEEIKVTYTATINELAEVGKDDAGNSVKLEYSNDPNTDSKGESLPDETHGYTFGFDLNKTDGETKTALAGAKFQLKKKGGNAPIKLIVQQEGNDALPAIARPAKLPAEETQAVETVTTPESGRITFKGLDSGDYGLVETEAPAGYNKLQAPQDIKIAATYDPVTGVLTGWTVNTQDSMNGTVAIDIENNKGALLPDTGGMGTVIFTVAGIAIIAGGIAWKRSRRAGNDA